jgi:hypothetical protein
VLDINQGHALNFHSVGSIDGQNRHYGVLVNPAAGSRVPGGPSSGSAVAVASKLVDFSLGMLLAFLVPASTGWWRQSNLSHLRRNMLTFLCVEFTAQIEPLIFF